MLVNMKHLKYILASLTTIISMLAEAQGNITGRVIDEQSQPIPFVNVVLLNRADSAFIMGTVTKDDGTFTIETDRTLKAMDVMKFAPGVVVTANGGIYVAGKDAAVFKRLTTAMWSDGVLRLSGSLCQCLPQGVVG